MGEVAKALGVGPTLTYQGKAYRLSPMTFETQAFFEVWLEKRAFEGAKRAAKHLPAADAERLLTQVTRDVAAGVYSFGGPVSRDASQSVPGIKYLVYLCLLKEHPDVTEDLVDKILDEQMEEALETFSRANADPNPKAPDPATGPG